MKNRYEAFLIELEVLVKQQGVYKVAKKSGVSANAIYAIFKPKARPCMFTVLKVCSAIGINFYFHDDTLHMARKFENQQETA